MIYNILSTQNHAVPLNMILDSIIFILVINDADTGMMRQKQGSNIQFGPDITFFTTGTTGGRLTFFVNCVNVFSKQRKL